MFHNNHNDKLQGGFFVPSLLPSEAPSDFIEYVDQDLDYDQYVCIERH